MFPKERYVIVVDVGNGRCISVDVRAYTGSEARTVALLWAHQNYNNARVVFCNKTVGSVVIS